MVFFLCTGLQCMTCPQVNFQTLYVHILLRSQDSLTMEARAKNIPLPKPKAATKAAPKAGAKASVKAKPKPKSAAAAEKPTRGRK